MKSLGLSIRGILTLAGFSYVIKWILVPMHFYPGLMLFALIEPIVFVWNLYLAIRRPGFVNIALAVVAYQGSLTNLICAPMFFPT